MVKRNIANVLIAAIFVLLLLPLSASAEAGDRIINLKPGTWASDSDKEMTKKIDEWNEEWVHYTEYYKINVKKSGMITFTVSKDAIFSLCTGSPISAKKHKYWYYDYESSEQNKMVAVNKGTYYLYVQQGKCKYTFKASAAPKNYCIAKAQKLKANKKIYNVLTPKTSFDRWFKIKNPKKKKIVFWSNKPEEIIILNSKYRRMSTIAYGADTRYCTEKALPKGTYYICVMGEEYDSWDDERDYGGFGDVITLKWK